MSAPWWHCEAASVPSTPQSNCHVKGAGTVGNVTCACATKKCRAGTPPSKDTSRTRYLMIGDSISMGMQSKLAAIVEAAPHNWTLTHNPSNAESANLGAHCVPSWMALDGADSGKWDVISFNFGLHDIAFDTERVSVEEYSALMTHIVSDIAAVQKRDGTKVLWVDTTPVPNMPVYGPDCDDVHKCINPPRFDDDVALYNKAARDVIAKANADGADVKTSADLYTFVLDKCGGKGYKSCDIQLPSNVHYTDEGWTVLAAEMAKDLLAL